MGRVSRSDVSEAMWKWRCKLMPEHDKILDIGTDTSSDHDESHQKEKEKEVSYTGIDATVKILYEGRGSNPSGNSFEWVDYPPKQISKAVLKAQERPAIKVFKIKDRAKPNIGGRLPLTYHSIDIQNSTLVEALVPILQVESLHLDPTDTATFSAPFRPLYFCHDAIVSLLRDTPSDLPLKIYLRLLVNVLDDIFAELRRKTNHLRSNRLANFHTMWTLFPCDTAVYQYSSICERVYKVKTSEYRSVQNRLVLVLSCKSIEFSGEDFVWEDVEIEIPSFKGNLPIEELPAYPLVFRKDGDLVKSRLVARGQKVLDFQELSYCTYRGIALSIGEHISRHVVDSRILVDVVGYNKYHLKMSKRPTSDQEGKKNSVLRGAKAATKDTDDQAKLDDQSNHAILNTISEPKSNSSADTNSNSTYNRLTEQERARNKVDMLALGHQLMYVGAYVQGYALKNKLWLNFLLDEITPIVWNDKAYDHLVYDELQKDLVLSFVENHGRAPGQLEDVIMGKGQGLVMLLSGPPGTGKTLTAEAVADRSHRPLFYLQAEDLGISAETLGENIKRLFSMAIDWDAVVLLDEADVFMSERSPDHIHRNELVSIFLRELEYFRGIIFLTTNLYHTIDPAFRSRLSLQLLFKPLSVDAREVVWRKFLSLLPARTAAVGVDAAGAVMLPVSDTVAAPNAADKSSDGLEASRGANTLSDADLRQLSLWQLNGREIKNAVKMSRSWCDQKHYALTLLRLENGIKVTNPHASKDGDPDESLYD